MKRRLASLIALTEALALSAQVSAQPAPPPPPPAYPPPQIVYPPPPGYSPGYGLPPPPGYYYPPGAASPISAGPAVKMDPDNPPAGYHTESRARSGLVVAGGVMFGIAYVFSAAAAVGGITDHSSELVPLFVPVAGPFVTLGSAHVFERTSDDAAQVGRVFGAMGLILDGIVQVSGFTLLVIGMAVRKEVVVKDSAGDADARVRPRTMVPDVAVGPGGMSARWTF
jgi:hypothetical protein